MSDRVIAMKTEAQRNADAMRFSSKRLDEVMKEHFKIPENAKVTRAALLPDLQMIEYVFAFNNQLVSKRISIDEVRALHQDVFSKL